MQRGSSIDDLTVVNPQLLTLFVVVIITIIIIIRTAVKKTSCFLVAAISIGCLGSCT